VNTAAFSWLAFRRDLELAGRAVRTRGGTVLLMTIPVVVVEAAGAQPGPWASWAQNAGLVGTIFVAAWAMRAYAPEVGRPIGEPPRSGWYLLWASICTSWPTVLAAACSVALLYGIFAALGSVAPPAATAITLAVFAPVTIVVVLQGWAYSYVAVDGAAAPDATMNMLREIVKRDVVVRAALLALLYLVLDVVLYFVPNWLLAHWFPSRVTSFILYMVAGVAGYTYFFAAILTTRPMVPSLLAVPWTAPAGASSGNV